jgi:hypothetical protein
MQEDFNLPPEVFQEITFNPDEINRHTENIQGQQEQKEPGTDEEQPGVLTPPETPRKPYNGEVFFPIAEAVLIWLICVVMDKVANIQINGEKLKTKKEDREFLLPYFDAYIKTLDFNFENPLFNMIFAVVVVYGGKVNEAMKSKPNYKDIEHQEVRREAGKKETRGRHKNDCNCIVCKQRRAKKENQ